MAALLLLAAAPVFLLIYPLVRLTSPGPFLFKQERPGKDGTFFSVFKIRTLRQGAERDTSLERGVRGDNPLVTPVGKILRDLKLDELPQLWNVLCGEMVLVGPRPLGQTFQRDLEREIPGFSQRLTVRPGLTSLAQVAVLESTEEDKVVADWKRRFRAERHYLQNRSPFYDMIIIGLTAAYIVRKLATKLRKIFRSANVAACLTLPLMAGCTTLPNIEGLEIDADILRKTVVLADPGQARTPVKRKFVEVPTSISDGAADQPYRIGTGDKLNINVFNEPGLSDLLVRVDAGGLVQLPIVEFLAVEGKTAAEVQADLKSRFSKQFNDPWVVVNVAEFQSRPVYLVGEFNDPGVVYLDRPTNVVQALGLGSGISSDSYLRGARLLRNNKIVPVDIYALLREGRFDQNVWLEGGDTLYVPGREDLKVFVLGAVNQPAAMPYGDGGVGLLEAIVNAQGPRKGAARLKEVRIIRSHSPTRGELLVVDMKRILAGESPDLPLKPGDIVYVPQKALADWNDVIAQIAPTIDLISGTLDPFVQLTFLSKG